MAACLKSAPEKVVLMTTNDTQRTAKVDLRSTRGHLIVMIASLSAVLTASDWNVVRTQCTNSYLV